MAYFGGIFFADMGVGVVRIIFIAVCPFSRHKGNPEAHPQMPLKQGSNAPVTKLPLQ